MQIATKLPYYLLKNSSSIEKLFQEQLKRLRTDHIDFYLMHIQAGRAGLLYAAEKDIPVIIMEPLRDGRLVEGLPDSAKKAIADYPLKRTPAQWAFH